MKHLVLVGLMGSGKTTVGRECARRLGRDFVDTDDVVEALAQTPIAEIFATAGEPHLRDIERQAVADVCASPIPLVIACGGGTVVDPANRKRLRSVGTVVWLRAPVEVLAARVGDGASRPLLHGDPRGALARLASAREAAYQGAAHCIVDTDGLDVSAVTAAVLGAFQGAEV